MKLRGGLWVPDTSDAEVLAAHAKSLASDQLDSSALLADATAPNTLVVSRREPITATSSGDEVALDLAARFINAMMR